MFGVRNPNVQPHVTPGSRTTQGRWQPMIPSGSYEGWGAEGGTAQGTPAHWTPNGGYVPLLRAWRPLPYGMGGNQVTRSPGAWYTPSALFQIIGIPQGKLPAPQAAAQRKRAASPRKAPLALNPFPSFAPPLPSYPLPASWPGRLGVG